MSKRKNDPFVRKEMGVRHSKKPFKDLSISVMTMDVRLPENCNLDYKALFSYLPVISAKTQESNNCQKYPPGTITAAKHLTEHRGKPPTTTKKSFKNATMIWIWLESKWVNMKISCNSIHITGCKNAENAAEAVRYLQQHVQLIEMKGIKMYDIFPYALLFDVHMLNYNFNLEVGIDLNGFDQFISEKYWNEIYSPYDPNLHYTSMKIKCPNYKLTITLNDNGQVSMCTNEHLQEKAEVNIASGYELFFKILDHFYSNGH